MSQDMLKKCARIDVEEEHNIYSGEVSFAVTCSENSFESHPLTNGWEFYGCPSNCRYFESHRMQAVKNKIAVLLDFFASVFRWFASLPWQTQLVILFLIILALAPTWIPSLIKFIEAIKK